MYAAAWLYSCARLAVSRVDVAWANIVSSFGSCTPLKTDLEPKRKFTPSPAAGAESPPGPGCGVECPRVVERALPLVALELLDDVGELVNVDGDLHARGLP